MKFVSNFTFLLPVYNGGKDFHLILKSLENLAASTNVIIYNDGSTDDSYQVACRYAEHSKNKVRIIDGKKNRGYFRVIKILLRLCPTDFYLFLGHDDQLSINYLDGIDAITLQHEDVICIFSKIVSVTPDGVVTGTWPHVAHPVQIRCIDVARTFNKIHWGNLFVAVWSKRALNQGTLLKIMKCIPDSTVSIPLKKSGFLNDNMAVLRALSSNEGKSIYYNDASIYYKQVDFKRVSEGAQQFRKDNVLHNPLGYLSIVTHFMLPQITQRSLVARWFIEYALIYLRVSAKRLVLQPKNFRPQIFLKGIALIFSGLLNSALFRK